MMMSDTPRPQIVETALNYFSNMVDHAYETAEQHIANGGHIIGIMCEFTPREVIMAGGGLPVCLCGGSAETIPAAETVLPANLCPLIKSTFGYHLTGENPFLEWAAMIVAETTCDGKKKMYELMAAERKMHILELTQKIGDEDAREHWRREVWKLKSAMETLTGKEITEAALREAAARMNLERKLRYELATHFRRETPLLSGRELLEFKSLLPASDAELRLYQEMLETLSSVADTPAGADVPVRVLLTGVPVAHGAESIFDLAESCGCLITVQENCTGLKPLIREIDLNTPSMLDAIADHYFQLPCSVMTHNDMRLNLIRTLVREYRIEAVIDLTWQACLTYDIESYRIRKLVENELGLPYLKIVTDYSQSDSERIRVRIEAMAETVRENR